MGLDGNINIDGSVRVAQTDVAANFVADTNNGAFLSVTYIGAGDATVELDDDHYLGVDDEIEGQIEIAGAGMITIERIDQTQVRVRTFAPDGTEIEKGYALVIRRRLLG